MEEQTAGHFSKQLGRFMMKNMAQLTAWSMTGYAQLMSLAMVKIGQLLEESFFNQRKNLPQHLEEDADDGEKFFDYDDQLKAVNDTFCGTDYNI